MVLSPEGVVMSSARSSLDDISIASPCPASWAGMTGDERVRFCPQCQLHVYNLSGMGRQEAEEVVARTEGRLCVRFFRRGDGTVLTQDCPRGLRAAPLVARRGLAVAALGLAAVCSLFGLGGLFSQEEGGHGRGNLLRKVEPFATFFRWLDPPQSVQGELCPPRPPAGNTTAKSKPVAQ
jgi:hypothetical protein